MREYFGIVWPAPTLRPEPDWVFAWPWDWRGREGITKEDVLKDLLVLEQEIADWFPPSAHIDQVVRISV